MAAARWTSTVRTGLHLGPSLRALGGQRALSMAGTARADRVVAAVCSAHGEPLVVCEVEQEAAVGPSAVRVQVKAAAVNFADILMAKGMYQVQPPLPFAAGSEMSGIVTEVGKQVRGLKEGDSVVGLCAPSGAFATEAVLDSSCVWKTPAGFPFEKAAAVPVAYGTAYVGLKRRARLQPTDVVFITAAAGGVGLAAVDIAANVIGCKQVIAAAGSDRKTALAAKYGAHTVINYSTQDVRKELKAATGGRGVDVVFDAVGGEVFEASLKSLAWEGRIVVVGFAAGDIPKIKANYLLVKNISAVGLYWGQYLLEDRAVITESIDACMAAANEGKLNPHVGAVFPLAQVNEAFESVASRESVGKVVLSMGGAGAGTSKL